MKEKLKKYINENLVIESKPSIFKRMKSNLFFSSQSIDEDYMMFDDVEFTSLEKRSIGSKDINSFIEDNKDLNDFQTLLFKMIDDRNLKDSDVYNKVHIDRRLFSKIRSDNNYHPSKETVILLGLSLELNENEIEELLNSASYSLPKNNHFDLIVRFCFINKIYSVIEVNDLLDSYKCKLFSY